MLANLVRNDCSEFWCVAGQNTWVEFDIQNNPVLTRFSDFALCGKMGVSRECGRVFFANIKLPFCARPCSLDKNMAKQDGSFLVRRPVQVMKRLSNHLVRFNLLRSDGKEETSGKSGIYSIVNKLNGHKYVGQSCDIYHRWLDHRKRLRKCDHNNPYLQSAWNAYREGAFEFVVLEYCDPETLDDKEQYWIERLLPEYNIVKNVFDPLPYMRAERVRAITSKMYRKSGESFSRPEWHLWVYGGHRKPDK